MPKTAIDPNDPDADLMTAFAEFSDSFTERLDSLEAAFNRPRPGGGSIGERPGGELARAHAALGVLVRTGNEQRFNEMSVSSDPAGGYTVVPALSGQILTRMRDQSPMRRLCRTVTIEAGDAWEEPIDDGDIGATWAGESQARPDTTAPTFRLLRVPVTEIYTHVTVTQRLLDDSRFDIGSWVTNKIADRFGRSEGAAAVSGDGVLKPKGFLAYAVDTAADDARAADTLQYVPSGHASQITADGLRDLYWALRAPHRKNATWLMSSATANSIDKLKDGAGNYLWRDAMVAGAPPSLLGRPVEISEDMPAIGAGNFPVALADWPQAYVLVDKAGIKYLRDPYSSKPNVIIYAYRRTGGGLALGDAVKVLKISAS